MNSIIIITGSDEYYRRKKAFELTKGKDFYWPLHRTPFFVALQTMPLKCELMILESFIEINDLKHFVTLSEFEVTRPYSSVPTSVKFPDLVICTPYRKDCFENFNNIKLSFLHLT